MPKPDKLREAVDSSRTRSIRTPRGKMISPRQYCALARAQWDRGAQMECGQGHFDCAAWQGGPCSESLRHEHGFIQEDYADE